jgi:DNA-binding GntR family transcriptional regulator
VEFQSKSDFVTAALREYIITGELEAGTPLRQRDLAEQFGVSPTPVREALRRLEAEGLVDYDLHRGATVIEASMGATEENYEIRAVLESLAARLAAGRITAEALDRLRVLHERLLAAGPRDAAATELNRQFHFQIYEASASPMLLALLRLLWGSFPRGPQMARPIAESVEEHAQILAALQRGDAPAAERLTREHILGAVKYLPVDAARRQPAAERADADPLAAQPVSAVPAIGRGGE